MDLKYVVCVCVNAIVFSWKGQMRNHCIHSGANWPPGRTNGNKSCPAHVALTCITTGPRYSHTSSNLHFDWWTHGEQAVSWLLIGRQRRSHQATAYCIDIDRCILADARLDLASPPAQKSTKKPNASQCVITNKVSQGSGSPF